MTECYVEGDLLNTKANIAAKSSLEALERASEKGTVLESVVTLCDSDHNLFVNLGEIRGIIPRNEGALGIDDGTIRDIALISKVNKPVQFVVKGFTTDTYGKKMAVLSRKEVQRHCKDNYIDFLYPGDVINAKITHLEKFGAFVDIGAGINSLVPIDMLSVSRISHPSQRVSVGEVLPMVIRNTDMGKITLSLREMLGTWEENAAEFKAGETVPGIIRSVETYGIFVELKPNLAGLSEPFPGAEAGQSTSVYIKAVIPEKMKVKLAVIDTFDDPCRQIKKDIFFTGNHMDYWRYSPESCSRVIETKFE